MNKSAYVLIGAVILFDLHSFVALAGDAAASYREITAGLEEISVFWTSGDESTQGETSFCSATPFDHVR
jgi:hypothetical protein